MPCEETVVHLFQCQNDRVGRSRSIAEHGRCRTIVPGKNRFETTGEAGETGCQKKKPKSKSTASKISATQSLLQELEVCQITVDYHAERRYQSKERVQIICASATVGDYHSVRKEEVNKIDWSQWIQEDVYEDMACIK